MIGGREAGGEGKRRDESGRDVMGRRDERRVGEM